MWQKKKQQQRPMQADTEWKDRQFLFDPRFSHSAYHLLQASVTTICEATLIAHRITFFYAILHSTFLNSQSLEWDFWNVVIRDTPDTFWGNEVIKLIELFNEQCIRSACNDTSHILTSREKINNLVAPKINEWMLFIRNARASDLPELLLAHSSDLRNWLTWRI